jgi:hypothetical protein
MPKIKTLALRTSLAATILPIALSGCSSQDVQQTLLGKARCDPGAIVWVAVDTSASTSSQRGPNGPYEGDLIRTLIPKVAADCGTLYAAPADGNAIADARWVIDDRSFTRIVQGNDALDARARAKNAQRRLAPDVRRLLHMRATNGSDLLGAMQRVALAAGSAEPTRKKILVLETDGVLNVKRKYDLYGTPIDTARHRNRLLARLKRDNELPRLDGFDVYISGVGVGVGNRETAKAIITFWQAMIRETGARLVSADSSLRFPR